MNKIIKIYWIVSWLFTIGWSYYIVRAIGWDTIMPMNMKLPLLFSFFSPVIVLLSHSLYVTRKFK